MKKLISVGAAAVILYAASPSYAEEVTLIAPGGMRCPVDLMKPGFEQKTGHVLKTTIGAGGATRSLRRTGRSATVRRRHQVRERGCRQRNAAGGGAHRRGRAQRRQEARYLECGCREANAAGGEGDFLS